MILACVTVVILLAALVGSIIERNIEKGRVRQWLRERRKHDS